MRILARRSAATAALALAATAGALLAPATAYAAEPTSFSMSGDAGDFITRGRSYDYRADRGDRIIPTVEDRGHITVAVQGGADDWELELVAPNGEELRPGEYLNAERAPFKSPSRPGLEVTGNGRGCNVLTGSFTINELVIDDQGWVELLDATFEQHCESRAPALRGRVHIEGPRPAPLQLGLDVAVDGTVDASTGTATIHGSVTCSEPTPVRLDATLEQVRNDGYTAYGLDWFVVDCTPGGPVPWSTTINPYSTGPYAPGTASVRAKASATDPGLGTPVDTDVETTVTLSAAG